MTQQLHCQTSSLEKLAHCAPGNIHKVSKSTDCDGTSQKPPRCHQQEKGYVQMGSRGSTLRQFSIQGAHEGVLSKVGLKLAGGRRSQDAMEAH